MELQEYIKKVIGEFVEAEGNEIPGVRELSFDIGLTESAGKICVESLSANRVKFTLEVKRK